MAPIRPWPLVAVHIFPLESTPTRNVQRPTLAIYFCRRIGIIEAKRAHIKQKVPNADIGAATRKKLSLNRRLYQESSLLFFRTLIFFFSPFSVVAVRYRGYSFRLFSLFCADCVALLAYRSKSGLAQQLTKPRVYSLCSQRPKD